MALLIRSSGARTCTSTLRLLNVKTQETRILDTGKGYVVKFDWSPDGQGVLCGTVANTDIEEMFLTGLNIRTVAVESGVTADVCVAWSGANPLTWALDGKAYFIDSVVPESSLNDVAV